MVIGEIREIRGVVSTPMGIREIREIRGLVSTRWGIRREIREIRGS
jgi:hypothetical protein